MTALSRLLLTKIEPGFSDATRLPNQRLAALPRVRGRGRVEVAEVRLGLGSGFTFKLGLGLGVELHIGLGFESG